MNPPVFPIHPPPPDAIEPDLTPSQKMKLFTEVLRRAHDGDNYPGFADRLIGSPEEAKKATQEVAGDLGLTIPSRDVVVFLPKRKAEYCHVFSLEPRSIREDGKYDANDFLLCCYPIYPQAPLLLLA